MSMAALDGFDYAVSRASLHQANCLHRSDIIIAQNNTHKKRIHREEKTKLNSRDVLYFI